MSRSASTSRCLQSVRSAHIQRIGPPQKSGVGGFHSQRLNNQGLSRICSRHPAIPPRSFYTAYSTSAAGGSHAHSSSSSNSSSAGSEPTGNSAPGTGKRRAFTALVATLTASITYVLGSLYPPQILTIMSPRPAPVFPSADSPEGEAYTAALEKDLQSLPFLEKLRNAPDADEWYEARPYIGYPEERRRNSLTAGALRGPGKLALPPLVRCKKDESEALIFVHVGRGVCGHDGIVHGGLLATLCDESLARVAILNLPDKVGVTATLTLDYKAPTHADQFIVIHTKLDPPPTPFSTSSESSGDESPKPKRKSRKVKVTGEIRTLNNTLLVEARATFVQPRYASLLLGGGKGQDVMRKALGERVEDKLVGGQRQDADEGALAGVKGAPEKRV